MALYNEVRPQVFSDVKGQEKIIPILQKDLQKGDIKNAYLFSGVRGTGKTTVARIMAKAMNCEHPLEDGSPCGCCESCKSIQAQTSVDVFELDAASNNSVEDVRSILEKVQYRALGKKKVFILDECHMLSTAASNALLKALEEPPEDVVFILCTTERHKVLPTIISRASCFNFQKIEFQTIVDHLKEVCERKSLHYEETALALIAKAANGGMRDALSILDKFIALEDISADTVTDILGLAPDEVVITLLRAIGERNSGLAIDCCRKVSSSGENLSFFIESIFAVLLDLVEFQGSGDPDSIIGATDYRNSIVDLSYTFSAERAIRFMNELRPVYQLKSSEAEYPLISSCIALIHEEVSMELYVEEIRQLKERVKKLEERVCNGEFSTQEQVAGNANSENSTLTAADSIGETVTSEDASLQDVYISEAECVGPVVFEEDVPDFVNSGQPSSESPVSSPEISQESQDAPITFEEDVPDFADSERNPFDSTSEAQKGTSLSFDELSEAVDNGDLPPEASGKEDENISSFPNLADDFARLFE